MSLVSPTFQKIRSLILDLEINLILLQIPQYRLEEKKLLMITWKKKIHYSDKILVREIKYSSYSYAEFFRLFNSLNSDFQEWIDNRLLLVNVSSETKKSQYLNLINEIISELESLEVNKVALTKSFEFSPLEIVKIERFVNQLHKSIKKLRSYLENKKRYLQKIHIERTEHLIKISYGERTIKINIQEESKQDSRYIQKEKSSKVAIAPVVISKFKRQISEIFVDPAEVKNQIEFKYLTFCWSKQRNHKTDILKLYTLLKDYGYIPDSTSIQDLHKAFNCKRLKDPIEIPWIKTVKGKISKSLLFHFIDQLESSGFIEHTYQNHLLFAKIESVFVDHNNSKLRNLDVSKSTWLNQRIQERTPQESELDMILYSIKQSS